MSFFTYLCICTFSCRVSTSFPRVAFNLFVSIKIWYYIFRHNKSSQAVAEMFTPYFETFVWLPSSTVQRVPTRLKQVWCVHTVTVSGGLGGSAGFTKIKTKNPGFLLLSVQMVRMFTVPEFEVQQVSFTWHTVHLFLILFPASSDNVSGEWLVQAFKEKLRQNMKSTFQSSSFLKEYKREQDQMLSIIVWIHSVPGYSRKIC